MVKLVLISRYRFKGDWTPLSGMIKLATHCKWHHCLFIWDGWCYEAVPSGVKRTTSESEFRLKIGKDYDILERDLFITGVKHRINECLGRKYAYLSLFSHLFNQLGWGFPRYDDKNKMTCGTFCAYVLGLRDWEKTDPQDLYRDYFK